jgi:hypothetical protein
MIVGIALYNDLTLLAHEVHGKLLWVIAARHFLRLFNALHIADVA